MKILVLTETYASERNPYANSYIHTRNLLYKQEGHTVRVLSFRAHGRYRIDGIEVYDENEALRARLADASDLWLVHAPNLKNHIRFVATRHPKPVPLVVFFHGHECLSLRRYYPRPYRFASAARRKRALALLYDPLKLAVMRQFVTKASQRRQTSFVFVSRWMRDEAMASLRVKPPVSKRILRRSAIIHNSVHPAFLEKVYQPVAEPDAHFITIRPLDESKYAIDRVLALARRHPMFTFHIYGRGALPEHCSVPLNVSVRQEYLAQHDIPHLLNRYRAAIMPTRLDSQGVMVCEMATYGIPVLTSDLDVCREMVGDFPRVVLFDHTRLRIDLDYLVSLGRGSEAEQETIRLRFSREKTIRKEMSLFDALLSIRDTADQQRGLENAEA